MVSLSNFESLYPMSASGTQGASFRARHLAVWGWCGVAVRRRKNTASNTVVGPGFGFSMG